MSQLPTTTYCRFFRLASLVAMLALLHAAAATAAELKIMPLGDSITHGAGGLDATGGYRLPLYNLLTNAGYDFRFVGSQSGDTATGLPATQRHHEGHIGYTIQNCTPASGARNGLLENVGTWLSTANPDVILLMIGANDIDADYDRAHAPDRLDTLLTTIAELRPDAHLIVAQITPFRDPGLDGLAQTYNTRIATVVGDHRSAGELVSLVDMHMPLNVATDLIDHLHPNQTGYNKMAQVWFDGIETAVVPEPSLTVLLATGVVAWLVHAWRKR